jgi:hypothetical protein
MYGIEIPPIGGEKREKPVELALLIFFQIVISCASLAFIAVQKLPLTYSAEAFHILFDLARCHIAIIVVAAFALVSSVFVYARFSFGYYVGFYLYTMILGYLWLICFTNLSYDHRLAGFSAATSAVAFLLPALFFTSPFRQTHQLSIAAFDRLLIIIFLLGAVTVVLSASYSFHFVGIEDMYKYRGKADMPAALRYLIGINSSTVLPFAFAGFVARKALLRAGAVLLLLVFYYPIAFSKLALFTPFWLFAMLLLANLVQARMAVVLSIFVPLITGILLASLFPAYAVQYLSIVNFRMVAIPSVAMDVYSDFFSGHDLTHFCQISVLEPLMGCPYHGLSITMERAYHLGAFNASLFATEGIASVGLVYAPIAALACGIVIGIGNRLSAGLPAGFILTSAAILPQVFLNVPLTTALLTHGAGFLFLLWYITPRTIFETGCHEAARKGDPPEERRSI